MTLQKSLNLIWLPSFHTDSSDTVEYSVDKQFFPKQLFTKDKTAGHEAWGFREETTREKNGITHSSHSITL